MLAAIMEIMNYKILAGGSKDWRKPVGLEKDGQSFGRPDEFGLAATQEFSLSVNVRK